MSSLYVVVSRAGSKRDLSIGAREQAFWNEHAAFIDDLVERGVIVLGGPFPDDGGAMIVVRAESEADVRARLDPDPWYRYGILELAGVHRWEVFIDRFER
ncbi:MAG: YciI family protein [Thermomicrobiales bacterium]